MHRSHDGRQRLLQGLMIWFRRAEEEMCDIR